MLEAQDSLWSVIAQGHSAQLLVDGKPNFDPNSIHPEFGTPLAHAIRHGRGNIVHTLLRHNPWLEFEFRGDSLLHLAVRHASRNEVSMLLASGMNPDVVNPHNETPLHYAAKYDKAAAAVELLTRGADPRVLDRDGNPATHVAIRAGYLGVARVIMDTIPRMIPNKVQETELHIACVHRMAAFVAYLANRFDDVDRPQAQGLSPLHIAVQAGDLESVKTLLAAKADPRMTDPQGRRPIDMLSDLPEERRPTLHRLLAV